MSNITRDNSTGLERLIINNDLARAEIYLHGAHVTHFQPHDQKSPLLWMSKKSLFQKDKAIRGGIPICFPWFGPNAKNSSAPQHGFARLSEWQIESVESEEAGAEIVTLQLRSSEATKKFWAADFVARYIVGIGRELSLTLSVQNLGDAPINFETALHTYFTVGDIEKIDVQGLQGATYVDRLRPGQKFVQNDQPIRFASETDRTYIDTEAAIAIVDPVLGRTITNRKSGSRSTVVWNPWIQKAKSMVDFDDDGWRNMVCVETANAAENAIDQKPGDEHLTTAEVRVNT